MAAPQKVKEHVFGALLSASG